MRVITEDFVAAGKPDYIRANAGIEYTDITTGIIYRQTTIPYGQNWVVVVREQVFNGVPGDRMVGTNGPLTGGGDLKADRTLGIVKADATHDGYVSAADWSSFNGKVPQTRTITIDGVTQDLSADRTWVTGGGAYVPYTGATADVDLGTHGISADYVEFSMTPTVGPGPALIAYDGSTGSLSYLLNNSSVVSHIGQTMHAYVKNAEAVTITKGQAVYLYQASGNKATVKLAYNTSDATSAKTLGIAAENILPNQNGMVICQGVIDGLNTGMYSAGDTLYLGNTAGSLTNVKPYAPNHLVYIGIVERANAGNGQIYVRVQNGYELDEIHDVDLVSTPPVAGNVLTYNGTLWVAGAGGVSSSDAIAYAIALG